MKLVEIVDGFAINVDEIISIKDNKDGETETITIQTENREYIVPGSFEELFNFLTKEERMEDNVKKMTTQFFGG